MAVLAGLGAAVATSGELVPLVVDPLPADLDAGAGLPPGVIGWGCSLAAAVAAVGGWLTGRRLAASAVGVAAALRLPEVMAASYESTVAMRPLDPLAFGDGWLHADVGRADDADLLEACLATLPPGTSARDAAAEAQAWRLAVCDYRARDEVGGGEPLLSAQITRTEPVRPVAPGGFTVVDLTTMWAGPLATWLLARLGARVVRVEPSFRPDGFRALDGRGIHPGGTPCDPGRDSAMFNALHERAEPGLDLDLRRAGDRVAFEELLAGTDLVVDSFSRRVMPNLGYRSLPGGATRASVTAFGPGPQADWVAYGTGVHAAMGLGEVAGGRVAAGAVSYADPLGGLALALGGVAAVAARRAGAEVRSVSTSLAAAVAPLAGGPVRPWSGASPPELGGQLLALAGRAGLTSEREVCGRRLLHLGTVFRELDM